MSVQSDAKLTVTPTRRRISSTSESKATVSIDASDKKYEEFKERKDLLISRFEYPRDGDNPGLVLIFNQENFQTGESWSRPGSTRDVNEIVICFSRLGFNIEEHHIYNDYSKRAIEDVIKRTLEMDLTQVNSLVVFFLSHGDDANLLHAYDEDLKASDLWKPFSSCKHLENKPKMFIFQACKGDKHSAIDDKSNRKNSLVPRVTFDTNYMGTDIIAVFSATEGNESYRHAITGTWFIQELCRNFTAYGRRDDVISLIMRTTKCLCRNYYATDKRGNIRKQMPHFVSTLRKKFYLNRSKDRNILLYLIQEQEKIRLSIVELEKKVNTILDAKNEI